MKLKKLFAAALLLVGAGAQAQTDVTSTYLTNADFSGTTASSAEKVYGYGKDGTPYGFQAVDGWTSVVTAGDNSNATYPNSGMGGVVVAYGSSTLLQGGGKAAPASDPSGNSGNCLGFFGVWSCGGYYYQNVTLPAGKYTLSFPIYNQSGTQSNTTYTGFFPTSGTNYTVAINTTVGSWVTQTVTFNLAAATTGQIRIGYQSTGSGSGANPHLFFDGVKIEYTELVVKDVLETALNAASTANATLGDSDLASAISAAQGVYDDEDATQSEVNDAAATLNAATELAMSAAGDVTDIFITNADFSSTEGWNEYVSGGYRDYGRGLIGAYNVRFSAATVDETHLATESCFGFECRWSGNYASYNQTTSAMPAGVYKFTFDVQNVNGNTTSAAYNNLFYVQVGDKKYTDSSTEWMSGSSSWTAHTITVTLEEASPVTLSVGYGTGSNNIGADNTPAIYVSHLKLSYKSFLAGAKEAWDEAVADAGTAKTECPNVVGTELTAVNTELAKAEPNTVDGYKDATDDLKTATAALRAAKANYDALVAEIAYAKTIGIASATADGYAATSSSTAATALTSTQNLKVLEYTTINTNYGNDVSSLLGTWPAGSYGTTSGQSYTGGDETYFDKWSGSADLSSSSTVTLPAGNYVIKVAGRGQAGSTMNLSVKVGDAEAVSTPFFMNGDTGFGIDKSGATNFTASDDTYSNGNIGRGWQYRYITFAADGSSEIVITINGHVDGQWQSFYAPLLLCDDATYASVQLIAAKAELQEVIDAAPAVLTANIGDGAFQIAAAGVSTYSAALAAAQAAHDAGDATTSSIATAKSTLESAIAAYNALEVNAPASGKLYNVILTYGGWTYDNKAITYIAGGRADMGNYNIQYKEAANTNLAQAFTFTKVSGNNYKMSQIDADGNVRYVSTGVPYSGGNTSQIRTVTDVADALVVTVIPTNTEGVWNLRNTEADNYIGSQDAGMYTVNSHIDFRIVETTKPSIAINTSAAGWGTTILPFAVAELPVGVKAYTCAAVADNTLTLVEVNALAANKPYIIEGSWNETLTGNAQGTAMTYTEGLLTGVYTTTAAPNGSYILQKQSGVVGFYQVDTEAVTPNVPANRAYLTIGGGVKAYFLGGGEDAIQSVFDGVANGEVYDLSGRKVARLQKGGTYVVNGKKVIVK